MALDATMVTAACRIDLRIPDSHSLKDKRQVLAGLIRRLRERHNASVIQLKEGDRWQKGVIGIALVAQDRREAESRLQVILNDVVAITGLKYTDHETSFY